MEVPHARAGGVLSFESTALNWNQCIIYNLHLEKFSGPTPPLPNPSQPHLMPRTTYISASNFRMSDIPERRKKELTASCGVISQDFHGFSSSCNSPFLVMKPWPIYKAYLMPNAGPKDLNKTPPESALQMQIHRKPCKNQPIQPHLPGKISHQQQGIRCPVHQLLLPQKNAVAGGVAQHEFYGRIPTKVIQDMQI